MHALLSEATWPVGDDEIARLVRERDWTTTALGGIENWSERLRGTVDAVLSCGFPMIALLGRDLIQVYNSGYARVMGAKHPGGMGMPTRLCWPEVWHINRPIYDRVWAGETVTFEDALYPIRRDGAVEDAWFSLSYSPLRRGEDEPAGVLVTLLETTAKFRAGEVMRENEAQLRAFVTASSDVVYRMGPDWREMRHLDGRGFIGDAREPITGWMERYILAEDRPAVRAAIDRAIAEKSVFDMEHRVVRVDGTPGWARSRAVPLLGAGGAITGWVGTAKDVTARREADKERRADETRQAFLLRFSDLLRAETNADTIAELALRLTAQELGADLVYLVSIHPDEDRAEVTHQFRRPGIPPLPATLRLSDFPSAMRQLATGPVVFHDVAGQPELTNLDRRSMAAMGFGAVLGPVVRRGASKPIWAMTAVTRAARRWTDEEIALAEEVAERTWAAIERARSEAALRDSEERFRTLAESIEDVFYLTDVDAHRLIYLSPSFERVWCQPTSEILSDLDRFGETIHPDDRHLVASGFAEQSLGEPVVREYRIVRPDGEVRWILDRCFPVSDGPGARRAAGVARDMTERRRIESALASSERWLTTLMEGVPQLLWRAVDGGDWTWAGPQWEEYTGQPSVDSEGRGWSEMVHPSDLDAALRAWEGAVERGEFHADYRLRHATEDRYRWFQTRATPVRDAGGEVVEWLGTSTEVDDLRQLQDRQRVLVAELQHRVRNILTVVRSVFTRTAAANENAEELVDHFVGRLGALARTQVIVTQSAAQTVDLENLVRDELLSVGVADGPGVAIEGPEVALSPKAAESMGLAVHELTTNALKYGALKVSGATLEITWYVNVDHSGRGFLNLRWTEQGVPAVSIAPTRSGFGRELIEEALPYRLGAETQLEFRGGGVRCSIRMPLSTSAEVMEEKGRP